MGMGPINSSIRGFLGYFGMQTSGGRNLTNINEELQGTFDYTPFVNAWATEQNVVAAVTVVAGALGFNAWAVSVPQNKIWVIPNIRFVAPLAIGSYFEGFLAMQFQAGQSYPLGQQVHSTITRSVAVAQHAYVGFSDLYKPIILPPGAFIGIYTNDMAGGANLVFDMTIRVREIDA